MIISVLEVAPPNFVHTRTVSLLCIIYVLLELLLIFEELLYLKNIFQISNPILTKYQDSSSDIILVFFRSQTHYVGTKCQVEFISISGRPIVEF